MSIEVINIQELLLADSFATIPHFSCSVFTFAVIALRQFKKYEVS